MKITAEQYGELCDVVERAWHKWPIERGSDEANMLHTSAYARAGAVKILKILGVSMEDVVIENVSQSN
jgi:hypothetical protein